MVMMTRAQFVALSAMMLLAISPPVAGEENDESTLFSYDENAYLQMEAYLAEVNGSDPHDAVRTTADLLRAVEAVEEHLRSRELQPHSSVTAAQDSSRERLPLARLSQLADPPEVVRLVRSLIEASSSCDTKTMDFLVALEDDHAPPTWRANTKKPFLSEYSAHLKRVCWARELDSIAEKVDRQVGKSHAEIFEVIGELAADLADRRRKVSKTLWIKDTKDAETSVATLRELSLDTRALQLQVQRGLDRLYSKYSGDTQKDNSRRLIASEEKYRTRKLAEFVVRPCGELVERTDSALSYLHRYERFAPESVQVGLKRQRSVSPLLDRQLEVHRICKDMIENKEYLCATFSEYSSPEERQTRDRAAKTRAKAGA